MNKKKRVYSQTKSSTALMFALPYFILFCLFTVLPVCISLVLGFTEFNMLEAPRFILFENYERLFLKDSIFIKAVGNTLVLALVTGPLSYILCLLFAWFINELKPGMRSIVTLIFYTPAISGNAYLIWQLFFSGDSYGYLNGILYKFNFISQPVIWLKTPQYIIPIVCVVALWCSLGTSFLAFIAGFQGVDRSYYESAAVDGVTNRWQELWFVTLPLMKPQMMFSAVMSITSAFGVGAIVTALMGFPTVNYVGHTIMNHLEDYGTTRYELGYASAIATILFLVMVISNMSIQKLISKVGS